MARKRNPDKSHAEKLVGLLLKLSFSRVPLSLTELAESLDCSKQTILRLVNALGPLVPVEESRQGNRRFYRVRWQGGRPPAIPLTGVEYRLLEMCHAFARHLLGKEQYEEVRRALLKSQAFVSEPGEKACEPFAAFRPGSIDYTPHQATIRKLLEAMEAGKLCKVTYCSLMEQRPKTFYIQPLKLFSHGDTVYLHARRAKEPGKRYKSPKYDPLLAIHRIREVELDERRLDYPTDYDFEKVFQKDFGLIKEEKFVVKVELSGWAARYVAERIWSPDQRIEDIGEGRIILTFSAASEPEVIGWVLSLADEAKVLEPDWLVEEVKERTRRMSELY
jgi:predicted DNA-binding transcriptional regulator YafY